MQNVLETAHIFDLLSHLQRVPRKYRCKDHQDLRSDVGLNGNVFPHVDVLPESFLAQCMTTIASETAIRMHGPRLFHFVSHVSTEFNSVRIPSPGTMFHVFVGSAWLHT